MVQTEGGMSRLIDRRFVAGFVSVFVALGAAFVFMATRPAPAAEVAQGFGRSAFECQVTRVHDGDTLTCSSGVRVRLNAINARELDGSCGTGHPCPTASGTAARDYLRRLALGQTLACRQTGTSYNRVTAWCAAENGADLSCAMVTAGMAARWERFDREGRLRGC